MFAYIICFDRTVLYREPGGFRMAYMPRFHLTRGRIKYETGHPPARSGDQNLL